MPALLYVLFSTIFGFVVLVLCGDSHNKVTISLNIEVSDKSGNSILLYFQKDEKQ